jgi:hypothetical protein
VKYPRIFKRQGESPPQYEDFEEPDDASFTLKASLHRKISYEELEACLSAFTTARPASEVVGAFYGGLSALNLVKPFDLVHAILGKASFQSEAHAQRAIEILLSLYNQIADSILHQQPFLFRPLNYPATRSGVLQSTRDLRSEIRGFVRGIGMGTPTPDDFTPGVVKLLRKLARTDNTLEASENTMQKAMEVLAEADARALFQQLDDMGRIISDIMLNIAVEMRELDTRQPRSAQSPEVQVGRNDPCPCGSGKKYKSCCLKKMH